MLSKKTAILLLLAFAVGSQVWAADLQKIAYDELGNPIKFWLSENEQNYDLKSARQTLAQPKTLYTFSQEVTSFDLITPNNIDYYLVFAGQDSNVYLTHSNNSGQTFSAPQLLAEQASHPKIAFKNNLLVVGWETDQGLSYFFSANQGLTFSDAQAIEITAEALAAPNFFVNDQEKTSLVFMAEDLNTGLNKVAFTHLPTLEAQILFETHDNLTNLGIRDLAGQILVFWQKEYLDRSEAYCSISLDQGSTFSTPQSLALEGELLDLRFMAEKLTAIKGQPAGAWQIEEVNPPKILAPVIIFPAKNATLMATDLKVSYTADTSDPLICNIDLATDENFLDLISWQQTVYPASQEALTFTFPTKLSDNTYFLRLSAFTGFSRSPISSAVKFNLDNTPPQITKLETKRLFNQLEFKGEISEVPSQISINGLAVPFEPDASFSCQLPLKSGENSFAFTIADEAGNINITTQEVFFNIASPEITVENPKLSDWYKPESAILIEASVFDAQGDIEDETEAKIQIRDELLEDMLTYSQEDSTLSGFITLPANLLDGKYKAKIYLSDTSNNIACQEFSINIDGSPPILSQTAGETCYTNSDSALTLPLDDQGAGIDLAGTLITLSGTSLEGSVSQEGETIFIETSSTLIEGRYDVEIIPRDNIGNIGQATTYSVVVDQTPPQVTLLNSAESQTSNHEILIEGDIIEDHPDQVIIYNNQKEMAVAALDNNRLAEKIRLFAGSNDLLIEVHDQAGNKTQASLKVQANFALTSGLIQTCTHGPNPFSPTKILTGAYSTHGNGMIFSYALAQPADVRILIYDITGTQIWSKEIKSSASGITAWNGVSHFGQIASTGIYPYVFAASAGGQTELRRGKIIITQ
ncbi:hypothetical protein ACFL5U_00385 [Candidatus Margulisiibacteriota bacterium]